MSSRLLLVLVLLCPIVLCAAEPNVAVEPWADKYLTVTDGLEYWFDAGRVNGTTLIPHDGKIATWYDASGHKRDLQQAELEAQPTRLPAGETAIVRFDGTNDFLRSVQPAMEREQFTIFVVAAPRRNLGGFKAVMSLNAKDERDFTSGVTL